MKKKTRVQEVCEWVIDKIERNIYLPRQKIPSIRQLAQKLDISTFSVAQGYDLLVSMGYIKSVSGSGFFVCEKQCALPEINLAPTLINNVNDTGWLMSHLFSELPKNKASGSGLLPDEWLIDAEIISNAIRKSAKEAHNFIYSYGHIQGYQPLRELFSTQLDNIGININPNTVITMPGVSSAIQTVLREVVREGDYVIVDDPSWFWLLGCLHQLNIKVVSVERDSNGPNIEQLESFFQKYKPKLYITNSILNNPTSYNISPSIMYKVLSLLHKYNAYLLEDDVYSHLEDSRKTLRYASLDQLERVFYVTGVSKILGANWRVGFLCVPQNFLQPILKQKMLSNMTSTELTERAIHKIWLHPQYKKHIEEMKIKLTKKHEYLKKELEEIGIEYPKESNIGIFLWINTYLDTTKMALEASKEVFLLAPGYLFSQHSDFSTYLRLNVTRTDKEFIDWLHTYKLNHKS
ncbi:PLP-dependent aminotransferase family protein [Actinobacillus genomosp. 2]|uniref:aminotransferase-like domain-containing protein n=1 Tax=Actinobacillus genomosp. 2 TaxID=230709 RepID=UPI002442F793|nr:PLP-dependent aminotransferase family protein [Actinobacillus genomosp. 2]WGE32291.1 PLP-dependent aminotransferase family protein [Actinobacillus genomosp. 2]